MTQSSNESKDKSIETPVTINDDRQELKILVEHPVVGSFTLIRPITLNRACNYEDILGQLAGINPSIANALFKALLIDGR